MYQLTTTNSIVRLADGAIIPADPLNVDWQNYQAWLADGNAPEVPLAPTREQLEAKVRQRSKDLRAAIFAASGLDGLQASALATGNQALALALEAIKQGLRDITKVDLSAATTDAEMNALVTAAYKALTKSAPASVQMAVVAALMG